MTYLKTNQRPSLAFKLNIFLMKILAYNALNEQYNDRKGFFPEYFKLEKQYLK